MTPDLFDEAKAERNLSGGRDGPQTRNHTYHWPGCEKQVPPAMWGCKPHWFRLPLRLRNRVWLTFRPGQEVNMTPSAEYLKVAKEVQDWVAEGTG